MHVFIYFYPPRSDRLVKRNKTHKNKAKWRGDLRVSILGTSKHMNWWSLRWQMRKSGAVSSSRESLEVAHSHHINCGKLQKDAFLKVKVHRGQKRSLGGKSV